MCEDTRKANHVELKIEPACQNGAVKRRPGGDVNRGPRPPVPVVENPALSKRAHARRTGFDDLYRGDMAWRPFQEIERDLNRRRLNQAAPPRRGRIFIRLDATVVIAIAVRGLL